MSNDRLVPIDVHYEIEQFLYGEARVLDDYELRRWIDDFVDPEIRYRMVVSEERFRKDRRKGANSEVPIYDDDYEVLAIRVRQFESGLQAMLDPLQRIRRVITNISAFAQDEEGRFRVLCSGIASRHRRLDENDRVVFGREDILRRNDGGGFRLVERRVELGERVVSSKNLLFFL